jgi:hypothetical protein
VAAFLLDEEGFLQGHRGLAGKNRQLCGEVCLYALLARQAYVQYTIQARGGADRQDKCRWCSSRRLCRGRCLAIPGFGCRWLKGIQELSREGTAEVLEKRLPGAAHAEHLDLRGRPIGGLKVRRLIRAEELERCPNSLLNDLKATGSGREPQCDLMESLEAAGTLWRLKRGKL